MRKTRLLARLETSCSSPGITSSRSSVCAECGKKLRKRDGWINPTRYHCNEYCAWEGLKKRYGWRNVPGATHHPPKESGPDARGAVHQAAEARVRNLQQLQRLLAVPDGPGG